MKKAGIAERTDIPSKEGDPMRIACITGASSGLGYELAVQIDRTEKNIDEIWLFARRKDRLESLSEKLTHPARIWAADLTEPSFYEELENTLAKEEARVGILANSAGFAKIGNYETVGRRQSDRMIDVNCKASVDMIQTVLPYMQAGDRIIQICSTASFQPMQHMNVYAASKAFMYSYTRALRMELLPRAIQVTAVCPNWIRDTEFIGIASEKEGEEKNAGRPAVRHFLFTVTAESVARKALRTNRRGRAVCTPGAFCSVHRFFTKLLPRETLLYFWELLRRA